MHNAQRQFSLNATAKGRRPDISRLERVALVHNLDTRAERTPRRLIAIPYFSKTDTSRLQRVVLFHNLEISTLSHNSTQIAEYNGHIHQQGLQAPLAQRRHIEPIGKPRRSKIATSPNAAEIKTINSAAILKRSTSRTILQEAQRWPAQPPCTIRNLGNPKCVSELGPVSIKAQSKHEDHD